MLLLLKFYFKSEKIDLEKNEGLRKFLKIFNCVLKKELIFFSDFFYTKVLSKVTKN